MSVNRMWSMRTGHRTAIVVASALVITSLLPLGSIPSAAATPSPCGADINPIVCENSQTTGIAPDSIWDSGVGDADIQGFATDMSVNAGSPISFKISTAQTYSIDIYRLGYYGGNGARLWQGHLSHTASSAQPVCLTDTATLLYDCGNWSVSAVWNVPSDAVSGVFIAKLSAANGTDSQIPFVIRNDASISDIVYQTSDPTWEAYNDYGGSDFYTGTTSLTGSQARAFKISYNRPFATRNNRNGRDFLFSNEYPTIRFMERNGFDMTYIAGVDTDRFGATLLPHHKVFLSVGHDEYWSEAQRSNVAKARDAGVSVMFLSGNEVYWHTRYEPSIDGSNTSYRTLVSYKETWDNAKIDPTTEWTGTWRDPRIASAPGGSSPENSLSGTMYMSNASDLPVTVTSAEGKDRLWRGTGLSSMAGSSTALAPHTVGYESDEDLDNGFRPAGLVDLSTATGPTAEYMSDFGNTVVPGTTTHHVTLYRASSGALVFSAGSIQWAWGLDQDHDGDNSNPPDSRMQQATLNMLADMHALPTTVMSGLVVPTPSTDSQAPSVTISSPASGPIPNGTQVTVTGAAADIGGGQVAGVEVSLDGGATWHPASGTETWSYSGVLHGDGNTVIETRATDDSGNTSSAASRTVSASCPCSLLGALAPAATDSGDASPVELGVRFSSDEDGYITGVRFYKAATNTGTHSGSLWAASGSLLATGTFVNESATGWQTLAFDSPVPISAGTTYVASYWAPNGHYSAASRSFYYAGYNASPLHAAATSPDQSTTNGVYSSSHGFPSSTFQGTNYFVDAFFSPSSAVPPSVIGSTPTPGATSVADTITATATFSKAINSSTIVFTLTGNGNTVPASVSYDSVTRTAKLTPASALGDGVLYTATVRVLDLSGNPLPAPVTWSFRTAFVGQIGGSCPCTIFTDSSVPTTVTVNEASSLELGIKFTADTDGVVSGVRFYKGPQNIGIHVGSLWTAAGTQLASATFTNESSTGWQTATFSSPVAVTAGTTYISSYHTNVGFYSATTGAYAAVGVNNFPLHVAANGSVFTYSTGYPDQTSTTDYGVDVVYTVPVSVVPSVSSSDPANGDTNVSNTAPIAATLSTSILSGTTSMTVTQVGGATVTGASSLNAAHSVLTFVPTSPLTPGASYSVTLSGARSLSGTAQGAPATWTFTTGGGACPCSMFASNVVPASADSGDSSAISLGMQVIPSVSGYITGVRFYKAAANTGVHRGSVWNAAGSRLGTVAFSNETSSGWQKAVFSQAIPVTAGSSYVVSYFAPNGHYSFDSHFFDSDLVNGVLKTPGGGANGRFAYGGDVEPTSTFANANYWVDLVFSTSAGTDTVPPSVSSTSPIDAASSVAVTMDPTVTFNEQLTASSITMTMTDSIANPVPGTVSYDAASRTTTFTPTIALNQGVTYTVSASAADASGNVMPRADTFSFVTARPSPAPGVCPCSVWNDATTPATISDPDTRAVELGATFTSDTVGRITGVRFYKGPSNIGPHTGTLWSSTGQQLATGTYTGESSTGWETLTFTTPVSVTAGTTYVVSYHTDTGGFSYTPGAFTSSGIDNAPLHMPAHAGLFVYGNGAFPTNVSDTNYWVDPVFEKVVADTTPPVISAVNGAASGTTLTITWFTDEPSSSRVDYGTSSSSLLATASTTGLSTTHSVAIPAVAPNTRYYFRVTSADNSNNSATSPASPNPPASWAPLVTPLTDSTTADFAAATLSSVVVSSTGDGEVVLTPTASAEFTGTNLPSGWTATNASGGSATVSVGAVRLINSSLTSSASYNSGKALEVVATLRPGHSIGWVTSSSSSLRFSFSVNSSNQLIATVADGVVTNASSIVATGWTPASHKFRIEWTASAVTFYDNDVQKYTHSILNLFTNLRPLFADTLATDPGLIISRVRVGPYAASGTLTSQVLDAKATVIWDGLSWDATVPTGMTLTARVRTGSATIPDATWSAYRTISLSGGAIGATSRYAQYQVTMTSTGSRFVTPTFRSAVATFHI